MHGKIYHIALCDDQLCSYNATSWNLIKPVQDFFKNMSHELIEKIKMRFLKHKYAAAQATVRVEKTLSSQEVAAINKRIAHTKTFLEKEIGAKISGDKFPRIAICLSGGGMRASICACGLFAGLDDVGLLDTVSYVAALSGSTWFLAHYLTLGLPINKYQEQLIKSLLQLAYTKSISGVSSAVAKISF